LKRLPAKFFRSANGVEPVKDWLKTLDREDCRIIGSDIKDVEFSFPIGLPLCRSLSGYKDLWEVRKFDNERKDSAGHLLHQQW
jgi:hypothetical protein